MTITLGFDVYGTLIDTHGVAAKLQGMVGDKAMAVSTTWREKQLEYTFRRGLMRKYKNFAVCTRDALEYTCAYYQLPIDDGQKQVLLDSYASLPAFADVENGLAELKASGYGMYAFSNGLANAVDGLLDAAGIRGYFDGVVSVDEINTFKPNPDVYRHFQIQTGSKSADAWLVSSNGFDVIGAISAGMSAAWVQRSDNIVFDPWGIEPTLTVAHLGELAGRLAAL